MIKGEKAGGRKEGKILYVKTRKGKVKFVIQDKAYRDFK